MKCRSKMVEVSGVEYNVNTLHVKRIKFVCYCTNDEGGKTFSIDNGTVQYTIPFDELAEIFKGNYKLKGN